MFSGFTEPLYLNCYLGEFCFFWVCVKPLSESFGSTRHHSLGVCVCVCGSYYHTLETDHQNAEKWKVLFMLKEPPTGQRPFQAGNPVSH